MCLPTLPDGCISDSPATTYPRVLPASLPSVSEPDRNQGGSLVLPGLELLPAPETLLNFELETKDGRSVTKPIVSHVGPSQAYEPIGLLYRGATNMATPLGIRTDCSSFLRQEL